MNTVIIHHKEDGVIQYLVNGNDVDLLIVDETCPNDRVYRYNSRNSSEEILSVIDGSPIGSNNDLRHEALSKRIEAVLDDKNHLEIVKDKL